MIDLGGARKRLRPPRIEPPPIIALVALAEAFQGLLERGEAASRADLARQHRLTRARVTQLMQLLRLHPAILAYIKALPPGTPPRLITERGLRPLTRLTSAKQMQSAVTSVPGFRASRRREVGS